MNKNLSNSMAGGNDAGPKYWKSLDEVADTPGFRDYLEREFQDGASTLESVDRRHFVKIMAASFALAGVGLAGCRRPERNILPFAKQPENLIPGKPTFYATSMPLRRQALPLLAQTNGGRPTKIEGNPTYERGSGKSDLLSQASVLDLYDPDRATGHRSGTSEVSSDEIFRMLEDIAGRYGQNGGAGLAFLAGQSSSPTRRALVEGLKKRFPQAIWAEYEPFDESGADRAASALLGQPARACYHPGKAARIVSLESDFLHGNSGNLYYAQSFARGRRLADPEKGMNRLYCVESNLTVTGGMADHRLRLSSTFLPAFAARLAAEVLDALGRDRALAQQLRQASAGIEQSEAWNHRDLDKWIRECAADLVAHQGESLLMPGEHLPEEVQSLIFAINIALGNVGSTMEFRQIDEPQAATIQDLAAAIGQDQVKTLFLLGGNPVYDAPSDLNWPELQQKVGEVIRYGYYDDESSEHAAHHIAATHYLEAWGDARTLEGTLVPVQPMIQPLFGGINLLELLAVFSDQSEREAYTLVQQTVARIGGGGSTIFQKFLHDGLLEGTEYPVLQASFDAGRLAEIAGSLELTPVVPSSQNLEVRFVRDNRIDDGRFVNNGWLQECPDPITKLTWDNAILVSPRLADELGVLGPPAPVQVARRHPNSVQRGREIAHLVTLTVDGRTIQGPVHVQPGLANYTVIVPIGYGRTRTGRVAKGAGVSAAPLRTSDRFFVASGGSLKPTGDTYLLASTQDHWSMEGRAIVREANLDRYREEPDFAEHMGMTSHAPPNLGEAQDMPLREQVMKTPQGMSNYEHPKRTGINQWGMVIDLNACSGCSACVVACQAENNIPIVGKDQVLRGREMHWMRLDRYFATGSDDNRALAEEPQVVQQPMLCQHCDNAPCEVVCPVNATVQDEEGLNVMVYNRCIGTRYCSNNCPYKVRRFNFFDWNQRQLDKLYWGPLAPKGSPETLKMQKNPNVTVRMRGVMEKCTFCIQRITSAKVAQKVAAGASDDVMVPAGAFQTACQQACPTEAITFGNMMDPDSEVVKLKKNPRNYSVLGYLNTRPRLTYLAKVRNPNPKMPDYGALPLSTVEYQRKNYPEGYHHAEPSHGAEHAGEANHGGQH